MPAEHLELWSALQNELRVLMHLDLTCADVTAEVKRLTALGARVLADRGQWVTMADPEGNEFDIAPR